ncbi:DUF6529 family protein [Streptomyces sp. NPDC059718]
MALHSLAGCFLYGAFVAKVVVVRHRRWPGWALPLAGGALVMMIALAWYSAAFWYLDGYCARPVCRRTAPVRCRRRPLLAVVTNPPPPKVRGDRFARMPFRSFGALVPPVLEVTGAGVPRGRGGTDRRHRGGVGRLRARTQARALYRSGTCV